MSSRFEASSSPLPLQCRLVGVLGAVVQSFVPSMRRIGQQLSAPRVVANELIGSHDARCISQASQQLL
jgi:hypothetical protein